MSLEEMIAQSFHDRMEEMLPDRVINTIAWDHQDQLLEITFAEMRDQGDGVGMLKTVALERALFLDEVTNIEKDLGDLIDEVLISIRNKDVLEQRIKKAELRFNPRPDVEEDDDE